LAQITQNTLRNILIGYPLESETLNRARLGRNPGVEGSNPSGSILKNYKKNLSLKES